MPDSKKPCAGAMKLIDLGAQQDRIRRQIDKAIARVLDHGQYIMGPEVGELEAQLATFSGAKFVLTCASGTDALTVSLMAAGIGRGDAVLCPAFTYTATPEAAVLLGASPVFVDIDEQTFNVSLEGLEAGIQTAKQNGLRPAAIIAVDLFGLPADYRKLEKFASDRSLLLICDAAQSFGASIGSRRVGAFGDVTATSFFPSKPLGCYGDGGAILTNNESIARLCDSIRQHGKAKGADKYNIERVGLNARLDTIQAAVLLEKLAIFSEEISVRSAVASRYTAGLQSSVIAPYETADARSVWAQYTIRVDSAIRDSVIEKLKRDGVPTAVYYPRPIHVQAAYSSFPRAGTGLAVAERASAEVLSLPMHPYLDADQQDYVIDRVRAAVRG